MEDDFGLDQADMDALEKKKPKFNMSQLAEGLSKKELKKEVSTKLSELSGQEIKPKDVTPANLKKVEAEAAVKPLEVKQAEIAEKDSPSSNDKLFLALAAAVPVIIGAAVGGAQGGALGGQVGAQAATTIGSQWAEDEKSKAAAKAKKFEKDDERAFQKELKGMETGAKAKEMEFSNVQNLRKEYESNPVTKATRETAGAIQKIQNAAEDPSAAGDLSLIFSYMKVLDPGSTVREGEFANAQNAGGVSDKVMAAYNNALKGERLTPAQRGDFVNQAQNLYKAQLKQQSVLDKGFMAQAEKFGLNPQDVVFGGFETQKAAQAMPAQSAEDIAALDWASANPKDPRAALIMEKLKTRSIAR